MVGAKNKFRILINIISIAVVCLFTFNTIAWSYPRDFSSTQSSTLQVQSIFNPIIQATSEEYRDQIAYELRAMLSSALKGKEVQDIDSALDISYIPARHRGKKRLLEIRDISFVRETDETVLHIGFLDQSIGVSEFKICTSCCSLIDVFDNPDKFSITEISASDAQEEGGSFVGIKHFRALKLIGLNQSFDIDSTLSQRPPSSRRTITNGLKMTESDVRELIDNLGLADYKELSVLILKAFSFLEEEGIDTSVLRKKDILVGLINKGMSEYMFEDCEDNGFVGINRSLFDIASSDGATARALFIAGLVHELKHESGDAPEDQGFDVRILRKAFYLFKEELDINDSLDLIGTHVAGGEFADKVRGEALPVPRRERSLQNIIGRVLKENRTLVVSDNIDALDQEIYFTARDEGRQYLRVSVKDEVELEELIASVNISPSEGTKVAPGKIPDIIRNGGILFIDYAGDNPALLEQFNSLYDKDPYFNYELEQTVESINASPDLRIVGVLNKEKYEDTDSTFRSRFRRTVFIDAEYHDSVSDIKEAPEDNGLMEVELYGVPHFADELIGKPYLDEGGIVRLEQGAIPRAIQEGRSLVISGESWADPAFLQFLRQLILRREVEVFGQTFTLPDWFCIYRRETDYSSGVENKRIVSEDKSGRDKEPLWIINGQNQDVLFDLNITTPEGDLVHKSGLLSQNKVRLRIHDNLADWVWHRIMHSDADITIELSPETYVPSAYAMLRPSELKSAKTRILVKPWEEVSEEKVVFIEGHDQGYVNARLDRELDEDTILYPVTPETNISDIVKDIEIRSDGEGQKFVSVQKEVITALSMGKTVIFEGVDSNPFFLSELETILSEEPYFYEDGERVDLENLPGRVIITSAKRDTYSQPARNFVRMPFDEEMAKRMLMEEYPDKVTDENFRNIMELRDLFRNIPSPDQEGKYPLTFALTFKRMELIYRYAEEDEPLTWLRAFEDIVISDYNGDPEVSAFMRSMVRLKFGVEEDGHKSGTIHGKKLFRILDTMPIRGTLKDAYWQVVDTMSLDLMEKLVKDRDISSEKDDEALRVVEMALARDADGEKREYYIKAFGIPDGTDLSIAPVIDRDLRAGEVNWRQRKEHAIAILEKFNAVFFRGPPGTGKSYITSEIAKDMGYIKPGKNNVVGPITVGVDVSEADVVSEKLYDGKETKLSDDRPVETWIPRSVAGEEGPLKREGKLFIVDEANLTKPEFWNFLRAFFENDPYKRYVWVNGSRRWFVDDDRIMFTGNQETLTGREFQELFRENVITVNFEPFDDAFLRERLGEYIHDDKRAKGDLIDMLVGLHRLFEGVSDKISFSLRDIQEISSRINAFTGAQWDIKDVVYMAWRQYSNIFDPVDREALRHLIAKKYGVKIKDLEEKDLKAFIAENKEIYSEHGIKLVLSAAKFARTVEDMLDMRYSSIGKNGCIAEGPSGRGKDLVLRATLEMKGFRDGNINPNHPADKKYYYLNASMRVDEMKIIVEKARAEGSIVVISEMNLLPTAFLEGQLNDVLTGSARPGFLLFATINSMDFSGREKLSTALQNRIVYTRIDDYSQAELTAIARSLRGAVKVRDIKLLVGTHVWIRDNIQRKNQQPTTRDIINALGLMRDSGMGLKDAVEEVYGPFYLENALKGRSLPENNVLIKYREKAFVKNTEILRSIGSMIIGEPTSIRLDAKTRSGGYHDPVDNSITLNANNTLAYHLRTLDHEAGHGLFSRPVEGFDFLKSSRKDPFFWLYIWLEDMRMERAMREHFPFITLGGPSRDEENFVNRVRSKDVAYLYENMTAQDIFKYFLTTYATGKLRPGDIKVLVPFLEGVYPVNLADYALRHLERAKAVYEAIPSTLEEDEIRFNQFKALKHIAEIRDDYMDILNKTRFLSTKRDEQQAGSKERASEEAGDTVIERVAEKINSANIDPLIIEVQDTAAGSEDEGTARSEVLDGPARVDEAVMRGDVLRKQKADLVKELQVIKEDLSASGRLSEERLREMLEQLENEDHPASLVMLIRRVADRSVDRRVRKYIYRIRSLLGERAPTRIELLHSRVNLWMSRHTGSIWVFTAAGAVALVLYIVLGEAFFLSIFRQSGPTSGKVLPVGLMAAVWKLLNFVFAAAVILPVSAVIGRVMSKWIDPIYERFPGLGLLDMKMLGIVSKIPLLGWLFEKINSAAGEGMKAGENEIPARYATPKAHDEEEVDEDPVLVTEIQPRARVEIHQPDPAEEHDMAGLGEVSLGQNDSLENAISSFFKTTAGFKRIWGSRGRLNVPRFVSGNPAKACSRTGGTSEKHCKEIMLAKRSVEVPDNPITREFLKFLLEKGFRITVFSSGIFDSVSFEGATSVEALFEELERIPLIPGDDIEDHLKNTRKKEDYEFIALEDLQKRVEGIYLYGALKNAITGQADVGPVEEPSQVKLERIKEDFERQKRELKTLVDIYFGEEGWESMVRIQEGMFQIRLEIGNIDSSNYEKTLSFIDELSNKDLTALNDIYVSCREEFDVIGPISGLSNIEHLTLGQLSGEIPLAPLAKMKGLKTLILNQSLSDGCVLRDLETIEALPELKKLILSDIGSLKTLAFLFWCENLETVNLFNMKIEDFSVFKHLGVKDLGIYKMSNVPVDILTAYPGMKRFYWDDAWATPENRELAIKTVRDHPNEDFYIEYSGGGKLTKKTVAGMDPDREINVEVDKIHDWLVKHGISESRLHADYDNMELHLNLSYTDVGDEVLMDLFAQSNGEYITSLNLDNTVFSDPVILVELLRLKRLSILGTRVKNLLPLSSLPSLEMVLWDEASADKDDIEMFQEKAVGKVAVIHPANTNEMFMNTFLGMVEKYDAVSQRKAMQAEFTRSLGRKKHSTACSLSTQGYKVSLIVIMDEFIEGYTENPLGSVYFSNWSERGLPDVNVLRLIGTGSERVDLSDLEGISGLHSLWLSDLEIEDNLSDLKYLRKIRFDNCRIDDWRDLYRLKDLEHLEIYGMSAPELDKLAGHKRLRSLILYNTGVSMEEIWDFYENYPYKEQLSIQVFDSSAGIDEVVNFRRYALRLKVKDEGVEPPTGARSDFSSQMREARAFVDKYQGYFRLASVDMEKQRFNLLQERGRTLIAHGRRLSEEDLSMISGWTCLERLNLRGAGIGDVRPLGRLENLRQLTLSDNPAIKDVSALSGLVYLDTLGLHGTSVKNADFIYGMNSLRNLNIDTPTLEDVDALFNVSPHFVRLVLPDSFFQKNKTKIGEILLFFQPHMRIEIPGSAVPYIDKSNFDANIPRIQQQFLDEQKKMRKNKLKHWEYKLLGGSESFQHTIALKLKGDDAGEAQRELERYFYNLDINRPVILVFEDERSCPSVTCLSSILPLKGIVLPGGISSDGRISNYIKPLFSSLYDPGSLYVKVIGEDTYFRNVLEDDAGETPADKEPERGQDEDAEARESEEISILGLLIESLLDRDSAMEYVKGRLESEGMEEEFMKALEELPANDPLKRVERYDPKREKAKKDLLKALEPLQGLRLFRPKEVSGADRKPEEEVPAAGEDGQSEKIKRKIEKYIKATNNSTRMMLMLLEGNIGASPIDIVIDLTLIPEEDLDENIETWGYIIRRCEEMKNVRFIFDLPDPKGDGTYPENLKKDIAGAASREVISGRLLAILGEEISSRIIQEKREGAVQVSLISKAWLKWMRANDISLDEGEYPVALDEVSLVGDTAALRNFDAAFSVGLMKAALAMALERDSVRSEDDEKEFPKLIEKMLTRAQRLYDTVFNEKITLTETTLRNMVHSDSSVRMNLAIKLALPPLMRDAVKRLEDLHNSIQLALQSA